MRVHAAAMMCSQGHWVPENGEPVQKAKCGLKTNNMWNEQKDEIQRIWMWIHLRH
jgi:hypothetical protein